MYYGEIKNCDIANGPGVRVSLFVSGCTNHCEGCFQPQTWDFHYGKPFDEEAQQTLLDMLAPSYIRGLTLLGGEPFEPSNQKALLPFLSHVREIYGEKKDIWAYTGFTFESLNSPNGKRHCEATDALFSLIDILVDGPFLLAKRILMLRFRGSENQRILDVQKSLRFNRAVEWADNDGTGIKSGRR